MTSWDIEASGLHVIDPLGYLDFLSLEAGAAGVLTDSGGVQEETTYLGVPCFTLRDNTERPVTIDHGTNTLLGLDPARIADVLPLLSNGPRAPRRKPPLWDGHAAERLAVTILDWACAHDLSTPPTAASASDRLAAPDP